MAKRIEVLDAFRGIAVLEVIFYHYTKYVAIVNGSHQAFFSVGSTGVMFFFMISGFVIFMTILQSQNASDFLYKRFTRLYPTFWVCLIITSILVRVFGLPFREVSWKDTFANISMIPRCLGFKEVDGAYWSLIPEFFFYLLMALLMKTHLIKRQYAWCSIWLAICLFQQLTHFFHGPVMWIFNLNYGYYFTAGIMFYKIKNRDKNEIIPHLIIAACFITSCLGTNVWGERIMTAVYFILFYLFIYNKINFLAIRPLVFAGYISFPLYLIHQNTGYIILDSLKNFNKIIPFFYIVVPVFICICIAYVLTEYVEKPSIKWLRAG